MMIEVYKHYDRAEVASRLQSCPTIIVGCNNNYLFVNTPLSSAVGPNQQVGGKIYLDDPPEFSHKE